MTTITMMSSLVAPATGKELLIPKEKFEAMLELDLDKYIKKRQGLDYLSWSVVLLLIREHYPTLVVRWVPSENDNFVHFLQGSDGIESGYVLPYFYDTKTGNRTEALFFPVYDVRFNSGNPLDASLVNKAIQRAMSKAAAVFLGIGYPIFLKLEEDIPPDGRKSVSNNAVASSATKKKGYI